MSPITIRFATIEDVSTIQQIAFSTWPVAYSAILAKEQLEYMLEMFYSKDSLINQLLHEHTFLLAIKNDTCIGFASFNLIDNQTYKHQKLYVLPSTQKTGAGKILLEEVCKMVKNLGAIKLQLNVNRHNAAIEFYKRMGFEIIKEDDINIGRNYFMNDYVMEKKI